MMHPVAMILVADAIIVASMQQPDLPDDFGSQQAVTLPGSVDVDAMARGFESPESVESTDRAATPAKPKLVLYTADSSWRCIPCEQQAVWLAQGDVKMFEHKPIKVPSEGRSPAFKEQVPAWEAEDGTLLLGAYPVSVLNRWAAEHAK